MLENISKLRLYEYQLACEDPSSHANKGGHLEGRTQSGQLVGGAQDRRREIGVLAQELSVVIPDAVQQTVRNGEEREGRGMSIVYLMPCSKVGWGGGGAVGGNRRERGETKY